MTTPYPIPGARPSVPSPVLGLAQWLRRRVERAPDRPAITCDAQTWTYGQFQQRIEALSVNLSAGGVGRGTRVAYLGSNNPMFLVAMFATARLGGIFVPLNFQLTGTELAFMILDAGIHTVMADQDHTAVIDSVRAALTCCHRYLSVHGDAAHWECASLMPISPTSMETPMEVDVVADDVAMIIYTSGTTGLPKGAMLTHGNLWTNNINSQYCIYLSSNDVSLNFAPMFHVGGLCSTCLPALMSGGQLVLQRGWNAADVMAAIARYKVTLSFAVPSMLLGMSQHPEFAASDLSSLRNIAVGGAPMPEPLLRLYEARGIPVNQGYGLTETTATATFLDPTHAHDRLGSCGTAPLMTEVRLADFSGQPLEKPFEKGEVYVRGGNVTIGYWNRPDATAAAFDDQGWFRTGDIAYFDEDGFLYICDRLKDMVISGGENVYPAEIESVLYEHPSIAEVAIIGAPDEKWGERVVAVVALRPNAALTLEELQSFAGTRLARYKLPRELRLVAALPRNPTGKVLKGRLREAAA